MSDLVLDVLIGLTVFGVLIGLALLAGPVKYTADRTPHGDRQRQDEGHGGQPDPPMPQFPGPFFPGGG